MPKVVSNSSPLIHLAKIGILIRARDAGKIDSLKGELEKLKETGFWLSEDLYTKILREGGE